MAVSYAHQAAATPPAASDGPAQVVNLCFHGIGIPGRALEPDEEQYWVNAGQFEELLDAIRRCPQFRITFDDGNLSDVTHALPALLDWNLTATFFVVAGRLDKPGSLARDDVRELARSGMIVGSHGMSHRPWRGLDDRALQAELGDATNVIADAAAAPVSAVACPFGSYDRRVLRALRHREFTRVYTVDGGTARVGAWLQSRHTILSHHTPADIERLARSSRATAIASAVRMGKNLVKRLR